MVLKVIVMKSNGVWRMGVEIDKEYLNQLDQVDFCEICFYVYWIYLIGKCLIFYRKDDFVFF